MAGRQGQGGGRPTKYKPEYCEQARKLCLLGYTDKQLADFFEVNEDTINEWKKVHPKFSESLRKGKSIADAEVAESLYVRSKGYEIEEQRVTNAGNVVNVKIHIPANPTAQIFWLKNRQSAKWRDKQEVEHSGEVHIHFDEQDKGLAGE
jgi:hypothetical protein